MFQNHNIAKIASLTGGHQCSKGNHNSRQQFDSSAWKRCAPLSFETVTPLSTVQLNVLSLHRPPLRRTSTQAPQSQAGSHTALGDPPCSPPCCDTHTLTTFPDSVCASVTRNTLTHIHKHTHIHTHTHHLPSHVCLCRTRKSSWL